MMPGPHHMPGEEHGAPTSAWRLGPPRRAFWGLLIVALVVSLALPLLTLWRASAAGLQARACMWPTEPRAGALAQVLVVIPASEASSVRDGGPAVQVAATMPGMTMGAEQASDNAPLRSLEGNDVFAAPITVSMPGSWVAHVTVRALGRPVWHETITFQARSGAWDELPLSTQSGSAATLCAASASLAPSEPIGSAQASQVADQGT